MEIFELAISNLRGLQYFWMFYILLIPLMMILTFGFTLCKPEPKRDVWQPK